MAFYFFDYAKMASAFDKFDKDVKDAIQDIDRECKTLLTLVPSATSSTSKLIPDYLINRNGTPFLIIEHKSQFTSLSESIFAKGLSEWDTYGILTDGKTFKVYGRKSCTEITECDDIKSAIKYLLTNTEDVKIPKDSNNHVCDLIISLANEHLKGKCLNNVKKVVKCWEKTFERFFEIERESFVLTEEAEQSLFRALLGHANHQLCRFSSFRSVFRMLKGGKIYLNNIMNMNDKTEGAYYDNYLLGHDKNVNVSANMIEYFIISCSDANKAGDFDMWRLYGDDTKGCCMLFSYNKRNNYDFKIFPVSYAQKDKKHPEVDFINGLVTKALAGGGKIIIKNLDEWKLFFKPYEYHNEKEIRILRSYGQNTKGFEEEYFINEQYGIASKSLAFGLNDFPLKLEKIILGSGLPEKDANIAMFEELLRKSIKDKKILVSCFDCKSYRV